MGPLAPEVSVPPRIGEDACVIQVPAGALVAAADPITFAGAAVGRSAVIVNANDVAVTGVRPRWFLATVLLPVGTTEAAVRAIFGSMQLALRDLDVALVGGHTEITAAVTQPVVAGQMLGLSSGTPAITTGGGRRGDVIVQIGPVPIEGAMVLAGDAAGIAPSIIEAAMAGDICVVEPALAAAEMGATALHDPTEGGLAGALHELAGAAGLAARVDRERVLWFAPGLAICEAVGADPWATLASGAVLATFSAEVADEAVTELTERGYAAAVIGQLVDGAGVADGHGRPIPFPERDEVARVRGG
jgi:hydrogenase maturation factor